jgi:hypothetical protein
MTRKQAESQTLRGSRPSGPATGTVPIAGTAKTIAATRQVGSGGKSTAGPWEGSESLARHPVGAKGSGHRPIVPYRRAREIKLNRGIFIVENCLCLILFVGVLASGLLITAIFALRVLYCRQ